MIRTILLITMWAALVMGVYSLYGVTEANAAGDSRVILLNSDGTATTGTLLSVIDKAKPLYCRQKEATPVYHCVFLLKRDGTIIHKVQEVQFDEKEEPLYVL